MSRALSTVWISLPAVCFALLSFVGGLATFALPETKDRELPDSTSELDDEEVRP